MTSTVKVTAHCGPTKEVYVGVVVGEIGVPGTPTDVTILQDGETTEKYIYDNRMIVSYERIKAT
jgi:hypothetical protein